MLIQILPIKVNTHKGSSKGYGVATFSVKQMRKFLISGIKDVIQNQGLGGILIIHHILDLIFSKDYHLVIYSLTNKQLEKVKIQGQFH